MIDSPRSSPRDRLLQQASDLRSLCQHIKKQGDWRQILITIDGAEDLPSVGDQLWLIYYNLLTIAEDLELRQDP